MVRIRCGSDDAHAHGPTRPYQAAIDIETIQNHVAGVFTMIWLDESCIMPVNLGVLPSFTDASEADLASPRPRE